MRAPFVAALAVLLAADAFALVPGRQAGALCRWRLQSSRPLRKLSLLDAKKKKSNGRGGGGGGASGVERFGDDDGSDFSIDDAVTDEEGGEGRRDEEAEGDEEADAEAEAAEDGGDEDDGDGVVSSIDDIIADEEDDEQSSSAIAAAKSAAWQADVKEMILASLEAQGLALYKLTFLPARIEVVVVGRPSAEAADLDDNDDEDYIVPAVDAISAAHRDIYARFETREADLDIVARFELAIASPGIGSVLRSRRDFETFRGFPVVVLVKEEYKKKRQFEGTLLERDDDDVLISLKGRIVKIPRALVDSVSLPKAKYESTDTEMRKLR